MGTSLKLLAVWRGSCRNRDALGKHDHGPPIDGLHSLPCAVILENQEYPHIPIGN